MKSILTLEITHQKPLPGIDNFADICANRIYSLAYARGAEVGIVAKLESVEDLDRHSVDQHKLLDVLLEILDFQSAPKGPTIHDWGRWRRVADEFVKKTVD